MSRKPLTGPTTPPSLRALLNRAHTAFALAAVSVVGILLAIPALTSLHLFADNDLRLLARAISFTVDAAVVFDDREATQEALTSIVVGEDVARASVLNHDGTVLARWQDDDTSWHSAIGAAASWLLNAQPASADVVHQGVVVGRVEVTGAGRSLARFLSYGVAGILGCQILIGAGAFYLSRQLVRRIIRPVQALAQLATSVQRDRAFGRRVPKARIAELDDLGQSFNALLAELDTWHNNMEGENRRLSYQANHDPLTSLANRMLFDEALARAVAEAVLSGAGFVVMLIDFDRFKSINDNFGHAAGDAVLVSVARRLIGQVRERDLVARIGGDEFAILLAPDPGPTRMHGVVAAIGDVMTNPVSLGDGREVVASLSVGCATYPDDGLTTPELLQHADAAMYEAKRNRPTGPVQPDR